MHNRQKTTTDHKVVSLKNKLGEKEPIKLLPTSSELNAEPDSEGLSKMAPTNTRLSAEAGAENLNTMVPTYCEQHPNKAIKFYCYDCKTIACVVCYGEYHYKHECCDVKEAAKKILRAIGR